MRIDLRPNDDWAAACERYREALPQELRDPNLNVQVYQGYEHALREIASSLAKIFSHKRAVAVVTEQGPALERLAQSFSAEGFSVLELTGDQLVDYSKWLPAIQTDLLFVAYAIDDPVTGKLHAIEEFAKAMQSVRVHRLALSHAAFRQQGLKRPAAFETQVLSLSPVRALMVAGERCKIRPQVADTLAWPSEDADSVRGLLKTCDFAEVERRRVKVEAFEASLPEGFTPLFQLRSERIFDRAVFYHEGIDGSALMAELEASARAPGTEAAMETTSPCRWTDPRFADWLVRRGLTPNRARGLVLVEGEAISPDLTSRLETAAARILKIQAGD